jgi:cellobiose phosphorylase
VNYGYFDDRQREYVITNPKTPVKWINYIGALSFGGFVDQTGGSLICRADPSLDRITKYIPQLPASDFKGEGLYLRIHREAGYKVFSPFFVPTLDPFDRYECHVGLGYTRIVSEFYGLRSDVTIFVPLNQAREIRDIKITNISPKAVELDAIPVIEYTHPDALKQFTNADWVPQTMVGKAVKEEHGLVVLLQYPFMLRDTQVNYFTSNKPASSFETERSRLLGDHEYGTWAQPRSLLQAELGDFETLRGDNIAALLHPLGRLEPGETRRLITQLGQATSLTAARPGIETYRHEANVDHALQELHAFWEAYLSVLQVETPEPALDTMINIHNPRQCYITKNWSRYLSLYQPGLGTRGIGFRDSSQDVMAVFAAAPGEGKSLLRLLLRNQKRDGAAMHQFNPLNMLASQGDAEEMEDRPHYYSDDHLWIVLAVAAYLKETGDYSFLDEDIPFYEKEKAGNPVECGRVIDHLRRAAAFTKHDLGAHGLPRLGFADWNDTVNLKTGAESVFTANLYGKALLELIDLASFLGQEKEAWQYFDDYAQMKQSVNQHAWDGAWYVRYFDYDGAPLGSRKNREGQIYINSQTWSVISGFATPERGAQALDAVHEKLNTPCGIKLSAPGFNGYDASRGGITTYPPGAKENGGIFLHTNPWAIIAETLLGNGDRAYEYYQQINPAAKNDLIDEYECEPYVYPQNILGDEHPQFGLARNSWLSGTASWAYQAGVQYILGIRPTLQGLQIDPCIPAHWNGFKARRSYRGAVYRITVDNPDHVCKGVASFKVDGKLMSGNTAPVFADGAEHSLDIVLGDAK